ncbi:MAG: sulfite exporter TauE/SafE family protein [Candidatus Limnocylindrales bacterium]
MTPLEAGAILLAGLAAGTLNTIVGSGSLITFPTLLAFGYAPLVANVSNTIGLVPGSASGVVGYRRELVGQRERALRLGLAAGLGGLTGGLLLLALPASAFARIVPVLILVACALVAVQPRLSQALAARHAAGQTRWRPLTLGVYLTAIYGGYFGAAQGVILIALLGIFLPDHLQRLNGLKNVLAGVVNAVAAVLFIAVAPVAWAPAALIAVGSVVGGQIGARYGRRLPPAVLRALIIIVGSVVAVRLLLAG